MAVCCKEARRPLSRLQQLCPTDDAGPGGARRIAAYCKAGRGPETLRHIAPLRFKDSCKCNALHGLKVDFRKDGRRAETPSRRRQDRTACDTLITLTAIRPNIFHNFAIIRTQHPIYCVCES
jgi:hypothetical protein